MTPRHDLENTLKNLLQNAERQLMASHTAEDALPVITRLRQLVRSLNYSTHRRSMAIFATQQSERICYMDLPVEQQIIIDEPLRTRDLAKYKKNDKEYLVMVLDNHQSQTYLGHNHHLRLIKSNTPQSNQFIDHMDHGLGAVLKVYPLPVFLVGPAHIIEHFNRITRHAEHIAASIEAEKTNNLEESLQPQLAAWDNLQQHLLLKQIEKAQQTGKLVSGLENVKQAAKSKNSRLLILTKNATADPTIDEIAEKVLSHGGNLEMIDGYANISIIRQS